MFTTLRSKILSGFTALIAINVAFGLWSIYQFSTVGESATDAIASNSELISNTVQLAALVDRCTAAGLTDGEFANRVDRPQATGLPVEHVADRADRSQPTLRRVLGPVRIPVREA